MNTSISARIERMAAQHGDFGRELLGFLKAPPSRQRLIQAAKDGIPPASAVSEGLVERFGLDAFSSPTTRQFVGWAIRAIMEEANFVPASAGINMPHDRLFRKGSTYKFVAQEHRLSPDTLLARILETLTTAELEGVKVYVEKKLIRRTDRRQKR
jgi:hypothetical protein